MFRLYVDNRAEPLLDLGSGSALLRQCVLVPLLKALLLFGPSQETARPELEN